MSNGVGCGDEVERSWKVYLVQFPDIAHQKFFVCLARSQSTWYGCLINSQLSVLDANNPAILAAVVNLEERDYGFLSHNSYFCADEHFMVNERYLASARQVGVIAPRHRSMVLQAVVSSQTMKSRAQAFIVSVLTSLAQTP